ncbi:epoxyqueuosine reductase QueH [Ruminococcus sp. FC2018]|uniref:epoxyqueuosine reductase QueH n=1 Tax=Ruminococcus sp. FC2018 TaxID=1410617 RepID=UPI00055F6B08|nr:epoxyqueuosine reductase QueH [Ruminococcus sp. FC2018]
MLDNIIEKVSQQQKKPVLLLHSCCAPCSSYVLEYLNRYFHIILFYYNPNISPKEEFEKRTGELRRLIREMPMQDKPELIVGDYEPEVFDEIAKGLEDLPEGGERCFKCYRMRLEKTAELARKLGADYFTTTLSISPYKNAGKLNEIAFELSGIYGVEALPADFKKKEGYKRSIELSARYDLYRQDYCGCVYSKAQRDKIKNGQKNNSCE